MFEFGSISPRSGLLTGRDMGRKFTQYILSIREVGSGGPPLEQSENLECRGSHLTSIYNVIKLLNWPDSSLLLYESEKTFL